MLGAKQPVPLTRRLVGRYLVFALAGLLICLVTTLTLAFRGSLASLVPLAAIGPAVLLAFGGMVLHQTVRQTSVIEQQLLQLAGTSDHDLSVFQTLPGAEPTIIGWNRLIERLSTQDSLVALEQRVSSALSSRKEGRLLDVLNSLSDGIVVTEKDGTIVLSNHAFAGLLKSESVDDVIGKNLVTLPELRAAYNAGDVKQAFKRSSGNLIVELRRSTKVADGVWRISRHPIHDDVRNRFVWTVRDITQQAIANESRNEFVSTATHELRTPLANIKAYAETLAIHEGIDVEQQKEFCNIINSEATRLSRFVDEVLNVSQIESGSMSLDAHETDIGRLLDDVIDHVQPQMNKKHIDFEIKRPPKVPKLKIDKDKFHAALVNLLGNAAKYTPDEGRVTFEIELRPSHIAFHVQDTGIGIAADELPRVFEKFYRSADERVKDISGNGLGLAFTHEVIRMHGGRATVESTLNEGSRFTVTLPL